jgi:hypothetical protein
MPSGSSLAAPTIGAAWPLRDKIAFAGIGTSRFGNFPETDSYGLGCEALTASIRRPCGVAVSAQASPSERNPALRSAMEAQ